MADEKKAIKTEAKKEAKPKKVTSASILWNIYVQGVKDRAEAVVKAVAEHKKRNITHNSKGKLVSEENLATLGNAIIRDVANAKKGHWATMKIVETDTQLKFVPK